MAGEVDRARHLRAMELFERACELAEDDRRALLDAECAEDDELRGEVESLLAEDLAGPPTLVTPGLTERASRMARELAERGAEAELIFGAMTRTSSGVRVGS